jgi:hypothetical protein
MPAEVRASAGIYRFREREDGPDYFSVATQTPSQSAPGGFSR